MLPHAMRTFSWPTTRARPSTSGRGSPPPSSARTPTRRTWSCPTARDFWETFDALVRHQDEPTAGSGIYSQWKVMELAAAAARHQGAARRPGRRRDCSAGYFRYYFPYLRDLLRARRLRRLRRGVRGRRVRAAAGRRADARRKVVVAGAAAGVLRLGPPHVRPGQGPRARRGAARRCHAPEPRPPRASRRACRTSWRSTLTARLLPSLLRYEDRNSMAFSIETRLPFLDYRLVEFVFSLPDASALDGTTTKAMLRRALGDRVPPAMLRAPRQEGLRDADRPVAARRASAGACARCCSAPGAASRPCLDRARCRARARGLPRRAAARSGSRCGAGSQLEAWLRDASSHGDARARMA